MDAETNRQLAFIVDELEKSLEFFRRKRNYNRIVTSVFIASGASLSAIATIALGASRMTQVTGLALVALIASGLATVVVALEALFAHRRLWSINNVALAELATRLRVAGCFSSLLTPATGGRGAVHRVENLTRGQGMVV